MMKTVYQKLWNTDKTVLKRHLTVLSKLIFENN